MGIIDIVPTPDNYGSFVALIKKASRQNIPRGCRTSYICGITDETNELYEDYKMQFQNDPFNSKTTETELPQDAHKTQTYNICMTKHSHFPYTSTCSSMHHNKNRKHNIHHINYTNTQHTSTLYGLKTLFLTTAATQQTFPQTPTQSLQQT